MMKSDTELNEKKTKSLKTIKKNRENNGNA